MGSIFGHGSKLRFILSHLIAAKLGNDGSGSILLMHALSGCDTVSAFHGIGKKTAWAVWCSMPHLATVLSRLARAPSQVSPDDLKQNREIFCSLVSTNISTQSCE